MKKTLLVASLLAGFASMGVWWLATRPAGGTGSPPVSSTAVATTRPRLRHLARANQRFTADLIPSATPPPEVLHPRLAEVLPGLAAPAADWRMFAPGHLTVSPIPGVTIEFTATSILSDGTHTIWTGVSGTPGVTLGASGTRDRWDAVVSVPGALAYEIHVSPAGTTVEKKDFGAEMCEPAEFAPLAPAAPLPPASGPAQADTVLTSDLLVLYTSAARNSLGGAPAVENGTMARIAAANTYLAQSQVTNLQWRVVGVLPVDYTETGNLGDDLNNLASPGTALGAFAAQQRNLYGADQVMLIVSRSSDNFAGIAFTPGAFSVTLWSVSAGTDAHELAHNFGCHHDRRQDNAPDNDGHYYYAYRYPDTTDRDTGTIMSYASFRVPYYSNPALTYQGHILGLAAGDPEAADNARVLRENAAQIAALRPTAVTGAPTITVQPASVTVTAGQAFTLSVTATGASLSYQWAHDGMAIPAGTGSSYAVSGSTAADGGAYAVTVSNASGSVQSSPATVTVNPVGSSPSPPTSSGNGSGGGGGAFDPLVALALVVLLARAVAAEPAGARRAGR